MEDPQSRGHSPQNSAGGFPQFQDRDDEGKGDRKEGLQNQDGLKILPFEFVALEACLEAACSCLESEVNFTGFRFQLGHFLLLPFNFFFFSLSPLIFIVHS